MSSCENWRLATDASEERIAFISWSNIQRILTLGIEVTRFSEMSVAAS